MRRCRAGEIVADTTASALEDSGLTLMDFVKQKYNYRADRVARALDDIAGREDEK